MSIELELLNELKAIKLNGPAKEMFGICDNVNHDKRKFDTLPQLFVKWPNFSGRIDYPIEGNNLRCYSNRHNHWDKNTKYGALRWELLDFLISELEK